MTTVAIPLDNGGVFLDVRSNDLEAYLVSSDHALEKKLYRRLKTLEKDKISDMWETTREIFSQWRGHYWYYPTHIEKSVLENTAFLQEIEKKMLLEFQKMDMHIIYEFEKWNAKSRSSILREKDFYTRRIRLYEQRKHASEIMNNCIKDKAMYLALF